MTLRPLVAALGGNALLRRGEPTDIETQRRNIGRAVRALVPLAQRGPLVITHGNGPQVGLLALQASASASGDGSEPTPLDVLDAESEGMIGYLLEQGLRNALPGREVATLLTQVVVDPHDPAFGAPTKPIGPVYAKADAAGVGRAHGWSIGRDGDGWRRVVASPEPQTVLELTSIRRLLESGAIVICVGGGGIPVVRTAGNELQGVEAVIDKDLASAMLAIELDAGALLLLTDVTAVQDGWGTDHAAPIRAALPADLRGRGLARGSMGPKVEAASRFAERTGRSAAIGALEEAALLLDGDHGTTVRKDPDA